MRLKTHRIVALALAALTLAGVAEGSRGRRHRRERQGGRNRLPVSGDPARRTNDGHRQVWFEAVAPIPGPFPPLHKELPGARGVWGDPAGAAPARAALEAHARPAGGDRGRLPGGCSARCPTAPRRPAASRSASRRRPPSCRAPTTGRSPPTSYRPTPPAGVYVPTLLPAVPHWGKRKPVGDDQRRPVPSGPAARADQRDLGAGLQRDQGGRRAKNSTQRTPEQTAIAKFWEATAPGRLLADRALGREPCPAAT